MEMKKCVMLIAMGVGGTLMYQQIMNGNVKQMMRDMKRMTMKACDDLEDMM